MRRIFNYINGKLEAAGKQKYLDVINPSNGAKYAEVPDSVVADVDRACDAATLAFDGWSKTTVEGRSRILLSISRLIEMRAEELARAESIDNGKPVSLARKIDIPRSSQNFAFFASAILQFSSESHHMVNKAINYTLRQPLGAVGCISPWNLPLYLLSWKIAPAVAAGNTVVAKPSEMTPMTAYLLSEICEEAGLPPGVLNIVHGRGEVVGEAIVRHPQIKAVSFTGSTRIGRSIASISGPLFKKCSLEMGGKNPNIIFADCDYEQMLETTIRSSFANQGQICLCGSRIFIEKGIYKKFKSDFISRVRELRIGDPLDEGTDIGAIVSEGHFEKVLSYISLAKEEGGTILTGGKIRRPEGLEGGYYIAPTVIEGLRPDCRTNQEEIFGPVVTIAPFEKEEEVVSYANGVEYGLSATLWTRDLARAHWMAASLDVGIVWINTWLLRDLRTPFGGVKNSGVGREGGLEALRFFTEPKNVCISYI